MLVRCLLLALTIFFCTENALAHESVADSSSKASSSGKASPWQFEVGISAGRPTPIMINAGIGYENIFFRAMGGGIHLGSDDFWVGYRGFLAWEFFRELPWTLDLGLGGGYAFAKAPNEYHKALNRANKTRYVRPYNYLEAFDISIEARASIYGVFTDIAIPVHYFMKHDEPTVLWQIGYAYRF